jgi:hypothetical protein
MMRLREPAWGVAYADPHLMDEHRYLRYFGGYANKEAALEALLGGHFGTLPHG